MTVELDQLGSERRQRPRHRHRRGQGSRHGCRCCSSWPAFSDRSVLAPDVCCSLDRVPPTARMAYTYNGQAEITFPRLSSPCHRAFTQMLEVRQLAADTVEIAVNQQVYEAGPHPVTGKSAGGRRRRSTVLGPRSDCCDGRPCAGRRRRTGRPGRMRASRWSSPPTLTPPIQPALGSGRHRHRRRALRRRWPCLLRGTVGRAPWLPGPPYRPQRREPGYQGLMAGADDYLALPLRPLNWWRGSGPCSGGHRMVGDGGHHEPAVHVGDVRLDPESHEVTLRSARLHLPLREFELLRLPMENAGIVLPRATLLNRLWGPSCRSTARASRSISGVFGPNSRTTLPAPSGSNGAGDRVPLPDR